MALKNHTTDNPELGIFEIVLTRLPMLKDTTENRDTLSILTLELMHELEPYFQIAKKPVDPTADPLVYYEVGDEAGYTIAQRSLIADMVAIQALAIIAGGGDIGDGTGGTTLPAGTYMKLAKAGSVQVEFAQSGGEEETSTSMTQGSGSLMARLQASAIRKGHNMGLIIDINADTPIAIEMAQTPPFLPFMTTPFS